jgi:hypothetical protein
MWGKQQRKQQERVRHTIATTDGNQVRRGERSENIRQKATQPMNNSEMDINTACLESMSVIMIGNEVWVYKIVRTYIK